MAYARGKHSLAISDRSGMAFPYTEMVKEWNGLLVHKSEFEAKHPQIRRKHIKADAIALANARPRGLDNTGIFLLYITNNFVHDGVETPIGVGMQPKDSDSALGTELQSFSAVTSVGAVTVGIS
tara:strand:+ start:1745 stop:2116 length:372 start_codon:yes stop_codon:yes gene_type:complete